MSNCAILVLSCDKYADLWDVFFDCFNKFWPDCPYKIYLGTNELGYSKGNIINIKSGEDKDWSSSARKIVSQIPENYIWIMLEDILIASKINTSYVENIFSNMQSKNASHIHELPTPKPDHVEDDFGVYKKGMPYRVNVRGFWNKKNFQDLLIDGESPWNFEIMGSYRSSYFEGFYCLKQPVCKMINSVEKGKVFPHAIDWCKENNIDSINKIDRAVVHQNILSKSRLQSIYFNFIINNISWKYRVKLTNILRKLIISY